MPFANVCNLFARLDKVEIAYRHRIQAESSQALTAYVERMTERSTLFEACWRRNRSRITATDRFMGWEGAEEDEERVRLPYQFKFRDNEMVSGPEEVKIRGNSLYPDGVRDMEMRFSVNFHRFWQNNGAALPYPTRIRNGRREVVTPAHFNLSHLFTLHSANFPLTTDTFNLDTNLFEGNRWHETYDVPTLFSKQLLFLRDYVEMQFPLESGVTHAQLQRRAVRHQISPREEIRILPDVLLRRAGGVAPIFNWSDFYIPHSEVAYDQQCVDAMQVVQDLMMRALGVGSFASAGFHHISISRSSNIPCVNINLTNNVTIAIYAKSLDRLRIEVRFKGSIHTILRNRIDRESTILEIVEETIDSATRRVIRMLRQLPARSAEPLNRTICMAEFIQHVAQAFQHQQSSIRHFLNSLAIVGSYAQGASAPCEYLVAQGILHPSRPGLRNTTVQYATTPQYAWIVETLRVRYFEQ